jgi:hypothetical protein
MQDWDLRTFYQEARGPVLWSWCVPAAFAGLVLPSILLNAGLQGRCVECQAVTSLHSCPSTVYGSLLLVDIGTYLQSPGLLVVMA